MHTIQTSALSFLAGAGLSALCLLAMAQKPVAGPAWDYQVLTNPTQDEINELSNEAWEYVGYLGSSTRGPSIDETLWRRPAR